MAVQTDPTPSDVLTPCADTVVDVAGLVKVYGDTPVVDDVSFHVGAGEIFGILGANGAGKTTAVECLQGLRRPDAGRISILGLDPWADRRRLRNLIGSQLQDANLPDRLRAAEAVALFDRTHRIDPIAHLQSWGLGDQYDTAFADLSGGQRQRLFVVLALLNRPQVVFLDELTQGLDPAARREVWQTVRRVRDDGSAVVLVSHFADEIEALCDRVTVIARGRVVDTGTPQELVGRHAPTTTITFTPPVGFDAHTLERVPGVTGVERCAHHIRVIGTPAMIAPVCARTIDDNGAGPPDVHVTHPNLDDALANLIGASR